MKYLVLPLLILLSSLPSYSQDVEKDSLSASDSSFMPRGEAKDYLPSLKLSADLRYRGAYLENEDFGESTEKSEFFSLYRALIGANIKPVKNLSFFTQVQSSLVGSKNYGVSPVDRNELELHQAFAEYERGSLSLRLGRQELSYGSQRLISVREVPNNRQSFDGIKFTFEKKSISLDLLYTNYVRAKEGIFNDRFSTDTKLWGAYLTQKKSAGKLGFELYYLGINKKKAAFASIEGREVRHSIGSRFFGKSLGSDLNYDIEAVYQSGRIAEEYISAWTLSSNLTKQFTTIPLKPTLGLKADIISGDRSTHRLGTFNPLFPKGAYFGLAALIGPANLIDLHPSIEIELKQDQLRLGLESLFLWRYSLNDGMYAANGALAFHAPKSNDRYIGSQFAGTLNYTPVKNILLRAEFTFFNAGKFLQAATPGKDIVFAAFTLQFKF